MITVEEIYNAARRELQALWNKVNDSGGALAAAGRDAFAAPPAVDSRKPVPQGILFDGASGATRDHWNAALKLAWRRKGGDWRDAKGVPHGRYAYAVFSVPGNAGTQEIRVPGLAPLVERWLAHGNTGLMLRPPGGSGTAVFASREHDDPAQRPRLVVETSSGRIECPCTADVDLPRSTYKATGTHKSLWVTSDRYAALQFDLADVKGPVREATLVLTTTKQYGLTNLDVMELMPPPVLTAPHGEVEWGLAAEVGEQRLDGHPDVLFWGDFSPAKRKAYTHYWVRNATYQREPALGGAISVRGEFDPSDNGSMSTRMRLTKYPGEGRAPTELYFRAYLYLEKDFLSETDGIKILGSLAATWENLNYQKEEDWGGGKKWKEGVGSDPCTGYGWSMRFVTNQKPADDNPYKELASLGVLAYWIGQKAYDGDYVRMGNLCLQTERWYCIEQRVKLNSISDVDPRTREGTPNPDGVFEVWVDGVKVYSKTNIRWRKTPDSVIQDAPWLNAYHGGRRKPKTTHHYRVANVVVAKRYIGPMKAGGSDIRPVAALAANSSWLPEPGHMVKLPAQNSFYSVDPCPRSDCSYNRGGGFNSSGNRYVVDAFSGGVFNPWYSNYGALVLHGGGHGDSGENSVYVFDLDTMKFARLTDPYEPVDKSAKRNIDRKYGEHPDGSPASAHTYDLLAIIPPEMGGGRQGSLLRPISLAVLGPALNIPWSHAYDFAEGRWSRYSKNACPMRVHASGVQMCALDTRRKRVWHFIGGASQACYLDLETREHVAGPTNRPGFGATADTAMMVYVPERDLLVASGTVKGKQRIGWFNPAKIEEGWRYAELSQALPADYTTAIGWSPDTQRLYFYSRASRTDIYEIEIPANLSAQWKVTWRPILGEAVGALDWGGRNSGGLYKRWDYVPALKCFIFMPRARETGVYLYRPHAPTTKG